MNQISTKATRVAGLCALALASLLSGAAGAQTPAPAKRPAPVSCEADAKFQELDFWIGDWEVSSDKPGAGKSADALVERVLGGCGLRETWTSVRGAGGNGIGMATYSRLGGAWRYFWISQAGANTDFSGMLVAAKSMQFSVEQPEPTGGKRLRHWTLSVMSDGRLSEVSVGSLDGGKTWTPEYELFWKKKP